MTTVVFVGVDAHDPCATTDPHYVFGVFAPWPSPSKISDYSLLLSLDRRGEERKRTVAPISRRRATERTILPKGQLEMSSFTANVFPIIEVHTWARTYLPRQLLCFNK